MNRFGSKVNYTIQRCREKNRHVTIFLSCRSMVDKETDRPCRGSVILVSRARTIRRDEIDGRMREVAVIISRV